MRPTVLLPLRADGKSRLAAALGPDARRTLAGAMLADVVGAVRAAGLDRIVLVAGGDPARDLGRELGLEVVGDPTGEVDEVPGRASALDRALAHAGRTVGGDTLVVAADLPALDAEDVRALVDRAAEVVVAPTRGGGTAALLRRPDACVAPAYGIGSAERHVAAARAAGRTVELVERAGLAHDVDRPEDLAAPAGLAFGPATRAALSALRAADAG